MVPATALQLAAAYFFLVLENPTAGAFPPVPTELLLVAGGSNAIYLLARVTPALRKLFREG